MDNVELPFGLCRTINCPIPNHNILAEAAHTPYTFFKSFSNNSELKMLGGGLILTKPFQKCFLHDLTSCRN